MLRIGIVTPTFNRRELLERLLASLRAQTHHDFLWLVVDDGSTDSTESMVRDAMRDVTEFEIRYEKVPHGGKARALNHAFAVFGDIDLFTVVDSDEKLFPDAVEMIGAKAAAYAGVADVGAIQFNYVDQTGAVIHAGGRVRQVESVLDRYEHDARYSKSDGCVSYFRRAIERYSYPEYSGEMYVAPTVLQMEMADEFKMVFTVTAVGVAEYQPTGLSRTGRKLRVQNPLGMIKYCSLLQSSRVSPLKRCKYAVMAQAYASAAGLDEAIIVQNGIDVRYLKPWAKPCGLVLAGYWRLKFGSAGRADVGL